MQRRNTAYSQKIFFRNTAKNTKIKLLFQFLFQDLPFHQTVLKYYCKNCNYMNVRCCTQYVYIVCETFCECTVWNVKWEDSMDWEKWVKGNLTVGHYRVVLVFVLLAVSYLASYMLSRISLRSSLMMMVPSRAIYITTVLEDMSLVSGFLAYQNYRFCFWVLFVLHCGLICIITRRSSSFILISVTHESSHLCGQLYNFSYTTPTIQK